MRLTILLLSALFFLLACAQSSQIEQTNTQQPAPQNIIFMIGDGMGPSYLTAYRYYLAEGKQTEIEPTIYDELWSGMSSTWPDDQTLVTDSAASATALATGVKSFNGAISVDQQHLPIGTMMQQAKRLGKANGIVASSQINHATPAAFLAHNPSRRNMDAIADMYVDYRINDRPVADVMLGGGSRHFIRDDRNLVNELQQLDYQYAASWDELNKLTRAPAMALLAEGGLPSVLNQPIEAPLQHLTSKALELLAPSQQGFVLMVEGSQIDWCGHANDIACAMAEMHDFALAIQTAKAFVDANPDTLLIITADHETGGLSLGANGVYEWRADLIYGVQHTVRELTNRFSDVAEHDVAELWRHHTNLPLTDDQLANIIAAQHDKDDLYWVLNQLINDATRTGWTTTGHTAADVPVLAYGVGAEQFHGFMDNTDIAQRLMQMINASARSQ
ncbi:alkaline phosphatase [Alkalimonas collagenimarina]|uniref:Alkaline phosphatase n=1 Tax=Alkalimonas collagenimarina TaxID=400390 RepID=A0ABT9GUD0_9GAMM|nr:alkaline phosphatase [Alkalimonas collagenimarina]MDP4534664.1 alkaline phosphatase [Alkalimonas collagenimarina]